MLKTVVMFALVGTAAVSAAPTAPDTTGADWWPAYQSALNQVLARRLLVGYPDLTYRPAEPATRYEAAAVLSRLVWYFDLDQPDASLLPPDVPWDHWCAEACRVLVASRLAPAPYGVRFCGDLMLTRGQWALLEWNLVQALRGVVPQKRLQDVADPYRQAAERLMAEGLFSACADGDLRLGDPLPRWQLCLAIRDLLAWEARRSE